MMKTNKKIQLSPKHGLNPALVKCFICGEDTNEIALMGKIDKEDSEAPKYVNIGSLCNKCKEHIDNGGAFIIEASDKKGTRTGRYIKLQTKLKGYEQASIAYMLSEDFEKLVKDIENGNNDTDRKSSISNKEQKTEGA